MWCNCPLLAMLWSQMFGWSKSYFPPLVAASTALIGRGAPLFACVRRYTMHTWITRKVRSDMLPWQTLHGNRTTLGTGDLVSKSQVSFWQPQPKVTDKHAVQDRGCSASVTFRLFCYTAAPQAQLTPTLNRTGLSKSERRICRH